MNADPAVEQRVLGCVIESAGGVLRDLRLTEEDFASPAHQDLWRGIHALLDSGRPLNAVLLAAYCRDHQRPNLLPLIAECVSQVGVPQEATWLAGTLRVLTTRRRIEQASAALVQVAAQPDMEPEELNELARSQVDRFTRVDREQGGRSTLLDAFLEGLDRWSKPDTRVLPTGWVDLDRMLTGGLRPGHLCVVGARPAVGKSLLATELARHIASRGDRVLFHSLEMDRSDLTDRIIASSARVPLSTLTAQTATEDEMERLSDHLGRVADWAGHLVIDDRSSITVSGIRGRARDEARDGALALVVVDYLQLVSPYDRKAPREQQVASVSRGLKLLARDLEVPVVALAQVGRAAGGDRPTMANLRESGAIEADADEVLLLHRDDSEELYGQIEVNVVKNRHGATGTVNLAWVPAGGRIENLG